MAVCDQCGAEIQFRNIGGRVIPMGCSCRSTRTTPEREDQDACHPTTCPHCGASVHFLRHNGGSVWLDDLGPPWPIHGCFERVRSTASPEPRPFFGPLPKDEPAWLCKVMHAGGTLLTVKDWESRREATWQIEGGAFRYLYEFVVILPRSGKMRLPNGEELEIRGPVRWCPACKRDLIGDDCPHNVAVDGWVMSDTPYPERFAWKEPLRRFKE